MGLSNALLIIEVDDELNAMKRGLRVDGGDAELLAADCEVDEVAAVGAFGGGDRPTTTNSAATARVRAMRSAAGACPTDLVMAPASAGAPSGRSDPPSLYSRRARRMSRGRRPSR